MLFALAVRGEVSNHTWCRP